MSIIQKDHENLFEIVTKNDPFYALNCYGQPAQLPAGNLLPFLDILNQSKAIPQDKKDKYVALYKKCGGKTLNELQKQKDQNDNPCITLFQIVKSYFE